MTAILQFSSLALAFMSINIFCMMLCQPESLGKLVKVNFLREKSFHLSTEEKQWKTIFINSYKNNHKFSLNRKTNHRRFEAASHRIAQRGDDDGKIIRRDGNLHRGKFMHFLNYILNIFQEAISPLTKAIWKWQLNLLSIARMKYAAHIGESRGLHRK